MQILKTIAETRKACAAARRAASTAGPFPNLLNPTPTLGLVPTMGALHDGHLSLVRAAAARCDVVAVSIFVNPAQFGPNEDFASYPRTFEEDCARLRDEGVNLLFAPSAREMYPRKIPGAEMNSSQPGTFIEVPGISERLDGRSRPGHFRGVATVVAKLFNIIAPDVAFFGQKDAAQVAVLGAMVRDLNFPVELVVRPTVRDADGLALSSRNRFLDASQRQQALVFSRALNRAGELVKSGVVDAGQLRLCLVEELKAAPDLRVDYIEIIDPATLEAVPDVGGGALIAVAGWVGETRLIDNLVIDPDLPVVVYSGSSMVIDPVS